MTMINLTPTNFFCVRRKQGNSKLKIAQEEAAVANLKAGKTEEEIRMAVSACEVTGSRAVRNSSLSISVASRLRAQWPL